MDINKKKQKGFTLVELSIVLVIIGLIVSSVLVGQDLVRAAELRNVVTQYQSFNAAVGTFRTRHDNGLPGDIDGADFGYTATGGDGDRVLTDGTFTAGFAAADVRDVHGGELTGFWNHLGSTSTGLINGSFDGASVDNTAGSLGDHVPATRSGESWGVFSALGRNYFSLGTAISSDANNEYTTEAVYSPLDALDIDAKIDDGRPGRGVIQARGAGDDPDTAPTAGVTAGSCTTVADETGVYSTTADASREAIACTLRFAIK